MNRTIRRMSGGVDDVWYMVIMPDEEYFEYAKRVANYLFRTPNQIDKNLNEYIQNGFMPIQNRQKIRFLFEELEIPSDCLGLISQTAAKLFGAIDDHIT